jgi:NADPH-dependent 2,4-dienoyl-CoA reductase/sulfur reductase-like enzyme
VSSLRSIVVVGASLAGLRCVEALRTRGYDGKLTLIGEEPHKPYDRPPLSKQLLSGEWQSEKLFFRKEGYDELGLDLRLGARASALDPRARHVLLADGSRVGYDAAVIATGAQARSLPNPLQLTGVHVLRTLDDALAIKAALATHPRVAVVGAGFIGLEVAASCRKLGLSVDVIEPMALPLAAALGERVGQSVARLHTDHGVRWHLQTQVTALEGEGRVERLRLSNGETLEADLVVVGIGVVPATAWLEGSGVIVDQGVLCDATSATNVPDVFAIGDVARWPNGLFDETMRVEHWSNAVEQAGAVATRLLAGEGKPYTPVPYFWSDQYDVKLQFAGRVRADDDFEVVQGSLDERTYVALYGRAGRLRGVLTSNRPQLLIRYRRLLSERASFDAALAAARAT